MSEGLTAFKLDPCFSLALSPTDKPLVSALDTETLLLSRTPPDEEDVDVLLIVVVEAISPLFCFPFVVEDASGNLHPIFNGEQDKTLQVSHTLGGGNFLPLIGTFSLGFILNGSTEGLLAILEGLHVVLVFPLSLSCGKESILLVVLLQTLSDTNRSLNSGDRDKDLLILVEEVTISMLAPREEGLSFSTALLGDVSFNLGSLFRREAVGVGGDEVGGGRTREGGG